MKMRMCRAGKGACAVPTIPNGILNGGHAEPVIGPRFARTRWLCPPHPHMGLCESRLLRRSGLGLFGERAGRGAMRGAARRLGPGEDWLLASSAAHCITSYPVGAMVRTHIPHA